MSRAARICDRCGKFYKTYHQKDEKYMDKYGFNKINGLAVADIDEDGSHATSKPKDLCPDCMKEFLSFMGHKSLEKEKKSHTEEIANEEALEAYHTLKTYCKGHYCEDCIFVVEKDVPFEIGK